MDSYIKDLLKKHGPCLTTTLIAAMVNDGVKSATARKRVSRSKSVYKRLAGLRFEKNARFVYLEKQYGSHDYWKALERAFNSKGKAYWGAVVGLRSRGGICLKSHFEIICGAPLRRERQLSPDRILSRLIKINLLEEVTDSYNGETCIQFKPASYYRINNSTRRAIYIAESTALQAFISWARNIGFGSYEKFLVRRDNSLPIVSSVAWDVTAPSYMRPLVSVNNGSVKPGFLVCDINLNKILSSNQVELYIRKHDMASAPMNVSPIMPFLIAEEFSPDAFKKAKSAGILAVTLSGLFGADISKSLKDLIILLSDTGATAAVDPERLDKVISSLTKIEGASANIRASLFELVIGNLVKEVEKGFLTTGYEIINNLSGRKSEIDVILDNKDLNTSIVIECKAKISGSKVSLKDVKKWYTDRVPLINDTLRENPHYNDIFLKFGIWTNGLFHQSALNWLNTQKTKFEKHSFEWKDGSDIKEYTVNNTINKHTRKILKEHYLNKEKI